MRTPGGLRDEDGEQNLGEISALAQNINQIGQTLISGTEPLTDIQISQGDKEKAEKNNLIVRGKYFIAHFLLGNISLTETIDLTGLSELEIKLIRNTVLKKKTSLQELVQWLIEKLQEWEDLEKNTDRKA